MKQTMRHIIATAIVAVGMGFAVSCSDNPEPAPPTPTDHTQTENDNEIPLLTVAPTEYTGYENLRTDTMPNAMMGGPINILVPVFEIIQHTSDSAFVTTQYDDEFFIEYEGKNYAYGDILPISNRGRILHKIYLGVPGPELDLDGISLGTFTSLGEEELGAEAHLILHWPKKNLKVFVRLYSKREDFDLPAGWHGRDRTEEGGFSITAGMFVNGIGTTCFAIHVMEDGSVKLSRVNKCYHTNHGVFNK